MLNFQYEGRTRSALASRAGNAATKLAGAMMVAIIDFMMRCKSGFWTDALILQAGSMLSLALHNGSLLYHLESDDDATLVRLTNFNVPWKQYERNI